jgi:prepilin-type N-terminal cleavage/methylation domain-containing protein
MLARRCANEREDEQGFTLIELLVVILVIGILAAIAIPVYLHQRDHAYDAVAKSDLNQLAQFEEMYLESHSTYGTIADIVADGMAVGPSRGDTVWVIWYDGERAFCLKAQAVGASRPWFYDSAAGGMQAAGATACPVTTGGTAGDSASR